MGHLGRGRRGPHVGTFPWGIPPVATYSNNVCTWASAVRYDTGIIMRGGPVRMWVGELERKMTLSSAGSHKTHVTLCLRLHRKIPTVSLSLV